MRIKIADGGHRTKTNQRNKMKNRFFFGRKILDDKGQSSRFFGWVKARWSSERRQWVSFPPSKTPKLIIPANDTGSADTTARFTDNQILGGA